VRQSGGHIAVESTIGEGSTVRLYMPRAGAKAEQDEARPKLGDERKAAAHEVILVVEDDGRVRKTATSILRRHGYEVIEANDAAEALQAVDRLPRLDLLFTDVVLANGMNGSELARQVLCRRPQTRILLTSGYARQLPVADGLPGDGVDLLPKPYRRGELTARVRRLLDRSAT
jgi:CheY-like chemotaxis protein